MGNAGRGDLLSAHLDMRRHSLGLEYQPMSDETTLPTEAEMDELLGKPGPAIEVDAATMAACVEASRHEARSPTTPSYDELVLVINDIHNHALAARLKGGDDGSLMLEIEELAETALAHVCDEGADDTEFSVVEDQP